MGNELASDPACRCAMTLTFPGPSSSASNSNAPAPAPPAAGAAASPSAFPRTGVARFQTKAEAIATTTNKPAQTVRCEYRMDLSLLVPTDPDPSFAVRSLTLPQLLSRAV